jgi:hypothetical protein
MRSAKEGGHFFIDGTLQDQAGSQPAKLGEVLPILAQPAGQQLLNLLLQPSARRDPRYSFHRRSSPLGGCLTYRGRLRHLTFTAAPRRDRPVLEPPHRLGVVERRHRAEKKGRLGLGQ